MSVSPEDLVSTCKYCGGLNPVSGNINEEDIYIVPSVDEDKILKEFWRRVRSDMDLRKMAEKMRIRSIRGWYVPFWISRTEIDGMVIYTKKEYSGRHVRIVEKRERFSRALRMHMVGRRQVRNIGVNELINAYLRNEVGAVKIRDLNGDWWRANKLTPLNIEFDGNEAEAMIREEAVDLVRKTWENIAHEIKFFKAEVKNMDKPRLVLLPLWEVLYEYEGSLYFAYHEGWRGSSLIFAEPMTVGRRALYLAGMISSIVGGIFAGAVFSTALSGDPDYAFPLIIIISLLAFLGHNFAKKFVSDVRVERSWR